MGWRSTRAAALALSLAMGCYEIPPRLPEDYIGSRPPVGWPPPRVYSCDPFAPENLWFHRLFGGRTVRGEPTAPNPAEPLGPRVPFSDVDLAELVALTETLLSRFDEAPAEAASPEAASPDAASPEAASPEAASPEAPPPEAPASAELLQLLASDARGAASRLEALGPAPGVRPALHGQLIELLQELGARGDAVSRQALLDPQGAASRWKAPPPLRAGDWSLGVAPVGSPHERSKLDPRPRRRYRSSSGAVTLVFGRVGIEAERDSTPTPATSECWSLDEGGASWDIWRFDRGRSLGCSETSTTDRSTTETSRSAPPGDPARDDGEGSQAAHPGALDPWVSVTPEREPDVAIGEGLPRLEECGSCHTREAAGR